MNRIIDIRKTETGGELITLSEVKTHLQITHSDDDTKLTALITSCRKSIESYCSISMVNKTIEMIADLEDEWELPYGPVIGIAGVQTATGQTGSAPNTYETQTSGWNYSGLDFPVFSPSGSYRYKVTYTAGYQVLPEDLKEAVLNEIAYRYEHRGEEVDKDKVNSSDALDLAFPYKRLSWL